MEKDTKRIHNGKERSCVPCLLGHGDEREEDYPETETRGKMERL